MFDRLYLGNRRWRQVLRGPLLFTSGKPYRWACARDRWEPCRWERFTIEAGTSHG